MLAYGQTRSGKNYNTLGSSVNPGLLFIFLENLFVKLPPDYTVSCSAILLYKERITDLLESWQESKEIKYRNDLTIGPYFDNLKECIITTADEGIEIIKKSYINYMMFLTATSTCTRLMNNIYQVTITRNTPNENGKFSAAKCRFCRLAGSERVGKSSLLFGSRPNTEIVSLREVIIKLTGKGNDNKFVPYRNSKLTFILMDSFAGFDNVWFIASLLPSVEDIEESISTLKFACRARKVPIEPRINSLSMDALVVLRLLNEIYHFKDGLLQIKQRPEFFKRFLSFENQGPGLRKESFANDDPYSKKI